MVRSNEYVRAYVTRYRDMFPMRMIHIVGITILAVWILDWTWAAHFAVCQFSLYALLWVRLARAAKAPAGHDAFHSLKRHTELITLGLATHTTGFSLAVALLSPDHANHVFFLIIGSLIVGALQVHISRLSFAAAVLPPMIGIALMIWTRSKWDVTMVVCMAAFALGVVGAAWRQMVSDRQAVELYVGLSERSSALEQSLAETEAQRAEAERANQAKSRFLAMISHDVRTPLNIILGIVEIMKRKRRSKAEQELVADMGDAGGMLLRLLNGALDLSKIESGQMEARFAPVDLKVGFGAIGRVWRRRAEELGLDFELTMVGADADFNLLADEGRIEQVAVNLLSNAMKMTPKGAVRLRAEATPTDDGRVALLVEVEDEGPGVPEAMRDRIFLPFEQLDAGRAAGGAGLGLAICRASLKAMGGEIGTRPATTGGAIFWFRLSAEPAQAPVASAEPQPPTETRRLSILAAEDNPANRKLLALLLDRFDTDLRLVENGAEAVTAAAEGAFDLILMDSMMPVMGGVAAVRAIRAAGDRTPVHMLTANVFDEDVARYLAAGADGVLRKPIEIPALHALLAAVAEAEEPELMRLAG